jgi:hypothetical protein
MKENKQNEMQNEGTKKWEERRQPSKEEKRRDLCAA